VWTVNGDRSSGSGQVTARPQAGVHNGVRSLRTSLPDPPFRSYDVRSYLYGGAMTNGPGINHQVIVLDTADPATETCFRAGLLGGTGDADHRPLSDDGHEHLPAS
jgi:hypothetical protein